MTGDLRRGNLERRQSAHKGDACDDGCRDGVNLLQAKESQRLPTNHQKLGEQQSLPHSPQKESTAAAPLISLLAPVLRDRTFLLSKLLSL